MARQWNDWQLLSHKTGWYLTEPWLFQVLSRKISNFRANLRPLKLLPISWGHFFCWSEIAHGNVLYCTYVFDIISKDYIHMNEPPPSLQTLNIITTFAKCCSNTLPNLQTFDIADMGSHVSYNERRRLGTRPLKFQKLLTAFYSRTRSTIVKFGWNIALEKI